MEEYLAHYSEKAAVVRLRLAHVLLAAQKRPDQALKVLAQIDPSALDARQRRVFPETPLSGRAAPRRVTQRGADPSRPRGPCLGRHRGGGPSEPAFFARFSSVPSGPIRASKPPPASHFFAAASSRR